MKKSNPKPYLFLAIIAVIASYQTTTAQVTLNANGQDDTYEQINNAFAPGHNVVETPDCVHTDVKHIDQVFDSILNKYVFRFKMHKTPDNDRCIKFDRQRTEIKTYDKSPDNLKAILKEEVEYKWNFKLDANFQPSSKFTHLHQIKAVGGSFDAMPLITLTARKGSPDELEIRYAEELSQSTIYDIDLAGLKGEWISAKETILFETTGKAQYNLILTRISDSVEVLNYTNNDIQMWKTGASFLRPKWGIYRSLLDSNSLRNEDVLFSDFVVTELKTASTPKQLAINSLPISPNPTSDYLYLSSSHLQTYHNYIILSVNGTVLAEDAIISTKIDVRSLQAGTYFIRLMSNDNSVVTTHKIVKD